MPDQTNSLMTVEMARRELDAQISWIAVHAKHEAPDELRQRLSCIQNVINVLEDALRREVN